MCLIWVYSLKAANVRMILNECVVSFPATTLFERVFPGAVVQTVVFSPADAPSKEIHPRAAGQVFPALWPDFPR